MSKNMKGSSYIVAGSGTPTSAVNSIGANGSTGPFGVNVSHGPQPTNPNTGDLWSDNSGNIFIYTQNGWVSSKGALGGSLNAGILPSQGTITNGTWAVADPKPLSVISIETKAGKVSINIENGDLTVPPGIGRDEAIREFWFGFQKHFQPSNKAKYEQEIALLKQKMEMMTEDYAKAVAQYKKDAAVVVAEKVRKKYGNEKFIMVKPEDLIKFIQD